MFGFRTSIQCYKLSKTAIKHNIKKVNYIRGKFPPVENAKQNTPKARGLSNNSKYTSNVSFFYNGVHFSLLSLNF